MNPANQRYIRQQQPQSSESEQKRTKRARCIFLAGYDRSKRITKKKRRKFNGSYIHALLIFTITVVYGHNVRRMTGTVITHHVLSLHKRAPHLPTAAPNSPCIEYAHTHHTHSEYNCTIKF